MNTWTQDWYMKMADVQLTFITSQTHVTPIFHKENAFIQNVWQKIMRNVFNKTTTRDSNLIHKLGNDWWVTKRGYLYLLSPPLLCCFSSIGWWVVCNATGVCNSSNLLCFKRRASHLFFNWCLFQLCPGLELNKLTSISQLCFVKHFPVRCPSAMTISQAKTNIFIS